MYFVSSADSFDRKMGKCKKEQSLCPWQLQAFDFQIRWCHQSCDSWAVHAVIVQDYLRHIS